MRFFRTSPAATGTPMATPTARAAGTSGRRTSFAARSASSEDGVGSGVSIRDTPDPSASQMEVSLDGGSLSPRAEPPLDRVGRRPNGHVRDGPPRDAHRGALPGTIRDAVRRPDTSRAALVPTETDGAVGRTSVPEGEEHRKTCVLNTVVRARILPVRDPLWPGSTERRWSRGPFQ